MRTTVWGAILLLVGLSACSTQRWLAARDSAGGQRARNVILLIGDGMGRSELTVARNYHVGASGRLVMDEMPFQANVTTYAVDELMPSRPVYTADSAAGATALATGHKTSNRRISTAPISGEKLTTIIELAQAAGMRTGVVTTADLTDATPAGFAAHSSHRYCRAPEEMSLCPKDPQQPAPASIAEQVARSRVDFILGGGAARFAQEIGPGLGSSAELAEELGYLVLETATALRSIDGGRSEPVLGLFAAEDFAPVWSGAPAQPHPGSDLQRCLEGSIPMEQPSLSEMTGMALRQLGRGSEGGGQEWIGEGEPGFFLMVEGALIDKRAHASDPCGQIGETIDFDQAVAVALQFARETGDTLVLVTADHAHAGQAIFPPSETSRSPGHYSRLVTQEGAEMVVNYGTSMLGQKQSHSATDVPLLAYGPGAEAVHGLLDNTEVFRIMVRALGLD